MSLTNLFVYTPLVIAIALLIWKWPGMKPYIAAGLFSSWGANTICHVAMIFNLWSYPIQMEETIVNNVLVPVSAMLWIRYAPKTRLHLIYWSLLWTVPIVLLEYIGERHSDVITYNNGYDWYFSFGLWFASWFVWYGFHQWFNAKIKN